MAMRFVSKSTKYVYNNAEYYSVRSMEYNFSIYYSLRKSYETYTYMCNCLSIFFHDAYINY